MRDNIITEEHKMFKDAVEAFLIKEAVPHAEKWEKAGIVDRTSGLKQVRWASSVWICPKNTAAWD